MVASVAIGFSVVGFVISSALTIPAVTIPANPIVNTVAFTHVFKFIITSLANIIS